LPSRNCVFVAQVVRCYMYLYLSVYLCCVPWWIVERQRKDRPHVAKVYERIK
jgi:hypothetical protein